MTVPSPVPFEPGPPVQEPVVAVSPSAGPQITAVGAGTHLLRPAGHDRASPAATDVAVTLSRSDGDPDDPTDGRPNPATTHSTGPWPLATTPVPGGLRASLPNPQLVPGPRVLDRDQPGRRLARGFGQRAG